MPPRAAPSSIPRSITVAGRTLSLDAVKHALIAWCVVRVLSSGFFGRAVTAVAAGCLAYGARALPGLVPGEWRGKCGKAGCARMPDLERQNWLVIGARAWPPSPRLATNKRAVRACGERGESGPGEEGRKGSGKGFRRRFFRRPAWRGKPTTASPPPRPAPLTTPPPPPPLHHHPHAPSRPAPLADSLKKLDAFTATADNRLYLSLAIDAVGALTAFEPKMLRALVGGAGWGPVSTFLVGFIYQVPPLTAISAFEESGYIPWFKLVPTATLGWLIHQKFIDEAGLRAGIKSVARTFGLA